MISAAGLEVDQAKVSIIKNMMPLTTVKGIRIFLGHAGFYRRFIRDFSKIVQPLCRLLEKDTMFNFDESCHNSFEEIKSRLVEAPIMAKPDWNREFEIMCDASDFAMGAVLGQKTEREFDLEIKDKKGCDNVIANHFLRVEKTCCTRRRKRNSRKISR